MIVMSARARFRLDGKAALVTGGASGIGAATIRAFGEQGASVVIADVDEPRGRGLASELADATIFQRLDVTDADSCRAAIAECVGRFGRLDVLVNCAGI